VEPVKKLDVHSKWESTSGRYTVVLEQSCYDEMLRLALTQLPNETGTALVGSYSDDGSQARISGLAPMTSDSKGTPSTFRSGIRGLRKFFAKLMRSQAGLVHYVGEWHSHPGGAPNPSPTDDANSMAIAMDTDYHCPELVLIILGIYHEQTEVRIFVYSRSCGRVDLHCIDPD
jgi:proteasome lid subunit RPN8/RPN11